MITIDIFTHTWFDRTFGNTYFAQRIVLDYGTGDAKEYINPFQYGYGSYRFEALKFLREKGHECDESSIIVREVTYRNCKKRELLSL